MEKVKFKVVGMVELQKRLKKSSKLIKYLDDMIEECFGDVDYSVFGEFVYEKLNKDDYSKFITILKGSKIIGFFFVKSENKNDILVHTLCIGKSERRKGYCKKFVGEFVRRRGRDMKKRGYKRMISEIYDDNIGSIRCFEASGFGFIGSFEEMGKTVNVYSREL
jgi:L-amino acid N-acyltransferase YncA